MIVSSHQYSLSLSQAQTTQSKTDSQVRQTCYGITNTISISYDYLSTSTLHNIFVYRSHA